MVWNDNGSHGYRESVMLSRTQKRDLLQILAAGALSTGVVVALVLVQFARASDRDRVAADVAAGDLVTVLSRDVLVPVSVPVLQPAVRPVTRRRAPASSPRLARAEPAASAKVSNSFVRLLVGNGQYKVRPFPTVPAPDR